MGSFFPSSKLAIFGLFTPQFRFDSNHKTEPFLGAETIFELALSYMEIQLSIFHFGVDFTDSHHLRAKPRHNAPGRVWLRGSDGGRLERYPNERRPYRLPRSRLAHSRNYDKRS